LVDFRKADLNVEERGRVEKSFGYILLILALIGTGIIWQILRRVSAGTQAFINPERYAVQKVIEMQPMPPITVPEETATFPVEKWNASNTKRMCSERHHRTDLRLRVYSRATTDCEVSYEAASTACNIDAGIFRCSIDRMTRRSVSPTGTGIGAKPIDPFRYCFPEQLGPCEIKSLAGRIHFFQQLAR
jgi:hypothetical protein